MFIIQTRNVISPTGLAVFDSASYRIDSAIKQNRNNSDDPDAIILRSAVIENIPERTIAIARAGVGVNNIPVDVCTARGIVVFNTPGANANSVKELVLSGMLLSNRKIIEGINWVRTLADAGNFANEVEKGKKNFAGPELKGKKLAVLGLGSIGAVVANTAVDLGMHVLGYDPYISIDSAWGLRAQIVRAQALETAVSGCDFISIHIPLTDSTRHIIHRDIIDKMKTGVRILNFSRGPLVHDDDIIAALKVGKVARYITDFPNEKLVRQENVLPTPHLGASTPEAEENCAVMACAQIVRYLETGNISNSVNFPVMDMACIADNRLVIINKNVPAVVGRITGILAENGINISNMINKHRNETAITIIDTDDCLSDKGIRKIEQIEGVIRVRIIQK
ncbi:MAG: 3-phosphoglycerate dehydrogenase family protein [Salinispira sp.]